MKSTAQLDHEPESFRLFEKPLYMEIKREEDPLGLTELYGFKHKKDQLELEPHRCL